MTSPAGYALSRQQQRIWRQQAPDVCRDVYRAVLLMTTDAPIAPETIAARAERLAAAHEIFRTRFVARAESTLPVQVIDPVSHLAMHALDGALSAFDAHRAPCGIYVGVRDDGRCDVAIVLSALVADLDTLDGIAQALCESPAADAAAAEAAASPDVCQYADYAAWLEESLAQPEAIAARAAWLATIEQALDLWRPSPRAADAAFIPHAVSASASALVPVPAPSSSSSSSSAAAGAGAEPGLSRAIDATAQACGVDAASVVLAAWLMFLRRAGRSACPPIGVRVDGRVTPELHGAAGPYDTCVPLVIPDRPHATFADIVRETAAAYGEACAMAAMFAWEDGPTARMLPFAFSDQRIRALQPQPWRHSEPYRTVERRVISERFEMALELSGEAGAYGLTMRVDAAVHAPDAVDALFGAFLATLTDALTERCAETCTKAGAGSGAAVTDRRYDGYRETAARLLAAYDRRAGADARTRVGTGAGVSAGAGIGEPVSRLIEARAARTPVRIAVTDGLRTLTYAQLDAQSNRLARLLCAHQMPPDRRRAALLLARTPNLAIAVLACLKAGVAFVPIDPLDPPDRIRRLIDTTQPHLIVSDQEPPCLHGLPALHLLRDAGRIGAAPADRLAETPSLDRPAYIMFTSGSTDAAKGVIVGQRNLACYLEALGETLDLAAADGYLHTAAIGFSSAVRQCLLPLVSGASVCLATRDDLLDTDALFAKAERTSATVLDLVPSYWRRVVRATQRSGRRLLPEGIRLALSASERLDARLAGEILDALPPHATLVNMYGLTESSGIVACQTIDRAAASSDPVPAGRPLHGTQIALIDEAGHVVPRGLVGEVIVCGPTVALGYLDATPPDAAAARFVHDDAASSPSAGLAAFRTGDLGRLRADGSLVLCGRDDDQIKIRGYRVDPGEIERHLAAHPGVEQAAIVCMRHGADLDLAAHIVVKPSATVTRAQLRAYAEHALPRPLVPGRIWLHDALPLTATGKIDRRALAGAALPAPEATMPAFDGDETAQRLAALWSRLMRCGAVRPEDDFFALGGHSLLAIDLVTAVADEFGVRLPWQVVYETPTVQSLAARIESLRLAKDVAR